MRFAYVVHIAAGALALLSGFVALYSAKGALLHRRSGMLFVYVMLTMALAGLTLAVVRGSAPGVNVPAALLTSYLVITSLAAVRPVLAASRALVVGGLAVVVPVAITTLAFGAQAVASGGSRDGIPAFPFFMFGVVGALAIAGDLRVILDGPRRGAARVTRHLWRMTFALFIATMSFFIGQAKVIPAPLRIYPLLALPVVAVLLSLLYWLWRVRIRGSLRGLVGVSAVRATT